MREYKYIEIEHISQRLVGRLNFDNTGVGAIGGSSVGSKQVDLDLLDRLIRQQEAIVEGYLNMIYITPLQLTSDITRNVLAAIVENLVVAAVLPIYYMGGSVPQTGVDPSSLAGASAESAQNMIQIYITGHSMYVPGVNSSATFPRGGPIPQPVVLPEERLRDSHNKLDTIVRQETYVGNFSKRQTPSNSTFTFDTFS